MSKNEKPKILLGKIPQKLEVGLKKGTTGEFYRLKPRIIFLVPEHKMHSGLQTENGFFFTQKTLPLFKTRRCAPRGLYVLFYIYYSAGVSLFWKRKGKGG
jgi:hypothetical protein